MKLEKLHLLKLNKFTKLTLKPKTTKNNSEFIIRCNFANLSKSL